MLKIKKLHRWDVSVKEAVEIQRHLESRIVLHWPKSPPPPFDKGGRGGIKTIAGADMAIDDDRGLGFAGVIVYSFPDLQEIERAHAVAPIKFPYVPGLLAFREAPILLRAFEKLETAPDLIMFDGQGIAHPRGLGIASHMGLFLGKPTIGCAKSRLVGEYKEPGPNVGDWSPLILPPLPRPPPRGGRVREGVIIGAVLRTRKNVKPIFVSPGHLIALATSIKITLACLDRTRIPKPTREADHFVAQLKRN